MAAPFKAAAETPHITPSHQMLASESGWLNTSRALKGEDLAGRIILVDFWTYCCINCMQIIPDLHKIEQQFGDKITVIGVHSAKFANEKDSENIRSAVLRYNIEHPVVNDKDFKIWNGFGVHAWPTLLLIGQDGLVKNVYSGEGNSAQITADIEKLIAKGNYRTDKLPLDLEKTKVKPSLLAFPSRLETGKYKGEKTLFISNSGKNEILAVDTNGKILASFKGDFNKPQGMLYDESGKLYVADTGNHKVKLIDLANGDVTTVAGTGQRGNSSDPGDAPANQVALASPWDLEFYPDDKHVVIANAGTHQLWSYDVKHNRLKIIAGSGSESLEDGKYPENALAQPSGVSESGGKLYFVDSETSSLRVLDDGEVKTLIGTGLFDFGYQEGKRGHGLLQHPLSLLASPERIFISDTYNHSIRVYDVKTGELKNFLGNGKRNSPGSMLNEPNDIIDFNGALYIANTNDNNILKYSQVEDKLSDFIISDESKATAAVPSVAPDKATELPNLIESKPVKLAAGAELQLVLKSGWHINAEAPSSLRLFRKNTAGYEQVQQFDKDAIAKLKFTLPVILGEYLLQGTVYHCADKAGSQCLINSINQEIGIGKGQNKLSISLEASEGAI